MCGNALQFQSTRPIRGATIKEISCHDCFREFQSTRPMRGATVLPDDGRPSPKDKHFNPRAPCGARSCGQLCTPACPPFQSTRPMRGATGVVCPRRRGQTNFNPRAPYGARLGEHGKSRRNHCISIHAPHTGRDSARSRSFLSISFQSTRPIRGATIAFEIVWGVRGISIHAPHTGRDSIQISIHICKVLFQSTRPIRGATPYSRWQISQQPHYFNPRAPYGARPQAGTCHPCTDTKFQSTRPIRGATTAAWHRLFEWCYFNPRAPYGARLQGREQPNRCRFDFNPRAPYGARQQTVCRHPIMPVISIHAPHTGRDFGDNALVCAMSKNFNPRAPYGARRNCLDLLQDLIGISIHAPHTGRDCPLWYFPCTACISIHAPHTGRDSMQSSRRRRR